MPLSFTPGATKEEFTVDVETVRHESVSIAVLRIVSAYTGRPIDELPPIADKVPPEAVDDLLLPVLDNPDVVQTQVTFRYCGFHITISSTGEIKFRIVGEQS